MRYFSNSLTITESNKSKTTVESTGLALLSKYILQVIGHFNNLEPVRIFQQLRIGFHALAVGPVDPQLCNGKDKMRLSVAASDLTFLQCYYKINLFEFNHDH